MSFQENMICNVDVTMREYMLEHGDGVDFFNADHEEKITLLEQVYSHPDDDPGYVRAHYFEWVRRCLADVMPHINVDTGSLALADKMIKDFTLISIGDEHNPPILRTDLRIAIGARIREIKAGTTKD